MARGGLLSAFQALVKDESAFDPARMDAASVERAIEHGFGPLLAHISRSLSAGTQIAVPESVRSADLTARVVTAEMLDALDFILGVADEVDCDPALLKGCAMAIQHYPEPHLRTIGDIDLIVPRWKQPTLEAALRANGFVETDRTGPASRYSSHHHGVPLWHPDLRVWLEVHTRLYSPKSPLAGDTRFDPDSVESQLMPVPFRHRTVKVLKREQQLVYTCARWAEYPSPQRGGFPILDAALLSARAGEIIDWALVLNMVGRSWAASALHVMLGYLKRWHLAQVPSDVMRQLAQVDRFTNPLLVAALHRFVTRYVMEGRPPGAVLTPRNLRSVWATMMGPAPPSTKLWTVPMNVAFPDGTKGRLNATLAGRRLRSLAARFVKR